jgi:hypothetical protein
MTTSPAVAATTGVTFSVAPPLTLLAAIAVIVVVPSATPVATPFASTVANAGLLLDQVNVVVTTLLPASRAVAVNACVAPTLTLLGLGVTVTLATGCCAVPQVFTALAVLRGFGVPAVKSVAGFPVNAQPLLLRESDVVLVSAGAFPSHAAAPVPQSAAP